MAKELASQTMFLITCSIALAGCAGYVLLRRSGKRTAASVFGWVSAVLAVVAFAGTIVVPVLLGARAARVNTYMTPPLGEPPESLESFFDGTETLESLLEEWHDTDRERSSDDVLRHNLIPVRLFFDGSDGQRVLLEVAASRIASSDENLAYYRGRAILQLGPEGLLTVVNGDFGDETARGLYGLTAAERRNLEALIRRTRASVLVSRGQIDRFESLLP